jgi:DhnA family fructose-bisphosphate aldolase class Ia
MLELPPGWFQEVTDMRVQQPSRIQELALSRKRRRALTEDGKLNIVAADHPARRVTEANGDPHAMADRKSYLERIAACLAADAVDGVMATMDILEELLILSYLSTRGGAVSFADNKLFIVSLNRGGLNKTSWELDDPLTSMPPSACKHWNMDGAKLLLRIDDDDPDSLKTIVYCRDAINELLDYDLPMFLEPLPVVRKDGGLKVEKSWQALAAIAGVASALGTSSSRTWLKLPYCDNFELVAQSTTLPILVLGGETQSTNTFLSEIDKALQSGENVRGTMVGRNVLFGKEPPVSIARLVHQKVHATQPKKVTEPLPINRGPNN